MQKQSHIVNAQNIVTDSSPHSTALT